MQDVAKFYGLQMNHSGMACCPFHDDRTPSLKVYDDHFYCFGCGATGDCTGFTAKLFGIPQIEAAKKISYDFGLNLFNGEIAVPVNPRLKSDNDFHVWLRNANLAVSEYLSKLNEWRKIYAPKNQWEQLHPLFVESLKRTDYVEYLADLLAHGSDKEKKLYYTHVVTMRQQCPVCGENELYKADLHPLCPKCKGSFLKTISLWME